MVGPTTVDRQGGQILLMTRPRRAAQTFVTRLDADVMRGVQVIYAPLIEIVPLGKKPDLRPDVGVIFTSANGVRCAPKGGGRSAFCVGHRTAEQARLAGYAVKHVAQDADHLVRDMAGLPIEGDLVHLSGKHRRGEIAARLTANGLQVTEQVIYDQPLQPLTQQAKDAFAGEVAVILPLFSPRTATHLTGQVQMAATTTAVALSDTVAKAADTVQFKRIVVASAPNGENMVQSIEKLLRTNRLP